MSKIKLAYVTHGLSSNGIESLLLNVMKHMDTSKYDVSFVIAIDEGVPCLHEKTVKDLSAKVIRICDMDSLKKKLTYMRSLEKVFRENQFDVVHANMDLLNGIVLRAAKRAGIKKRICHAHTSGSNYKFDENKSKLISLAQKIYRRMMKHLILSNSTVLLGCSEEANKYFYSKKASQAKIIYNGIDLHSFTSKEKKTVSGIEKRNINLVTVGRISIPKNPIFIVDIIKALSSLRQDFVLNWVGAGEMEEQVKAYIKEQGVADYINMTGVRTDVADILHSSDYFIFPSLFEGLGIVLIEAQAAGVECFASTEVPTLADLGACHYLPLSFGAEKWAEEINNAINSGVRMTASDEKIQQFDIRKTVSDLDKVYCEE
ncbi:MAG: glycosyltransferase [Clostridia bacterium]|nr:glycosyltransferase [Clostridia bacterium]